MGKLKAENPQLSVYYNDRDHVTIIVQTPHKLSALSHMLHTTQAQIKQVTCSNILHLLASLYCAIQYG